MQRGTEARTRRRAAKDRITIRIDRDVLDQFKELATEGRSYQRLINGALREWLAARGVKELIREELEGLTERVVSAVLASGKASSGQATS